MTNEEERAEAPEAMPNWRVDDVRGGLSANLIPPWWDKHGITAHHGPGMRDPIAVSSHEALSGMAILHGAVLYESTVSGRCDDPRALVDALIASGGRLCSESWQERDPFEMRPFNHPSPAQHVGLWVAGHHAMVRVSWEAFVAGEDAACCAPDDALRGAGVVNASITALGPALHDHLRRAVSSKVRRTLDVDRPPEERTVHMLVHGGEGYAALPVGTVRDVLVEANYTPSAVDALRRCAASINSPRPNGRLSIVTGPRGTGKTHLLRALMGMVPDATFLMMDPELLSGLTKPALTGFLVREREEHGPKPLVFLIEDGDRALSERYVGNLDLVQPLLNLGGGLAGDLLGVHVVVTTNAAIGKELTIDKALSRKGRLAALVETDLLAAAHANAVYGRLLPERSAHEAPFSAAASLADVYARAIEDGWVDDGPAPEPRLSMAHKIRRLR